VLTIKPCMLYFALREGSVGYLILDDQQRRTPAISEPYGRNRYRVQYSTHPSLREARQLINYLRTKQLYANVVPVVCSQLQVFQWLLSGLSKQALGARVLPRSRA